MSHQPDPRSVPLSRRTVLAGGLAGAALGLAPSAAAQAVPGRGPGKPGVLPAGVDRGTLMRWAEEKYVPLLVQRCYNTDTNHKSAGTIS